MRRRRLEAERGMGLGGLLAQRTVGAGCLGAGVADGRIELGVQIVRDLPDVRLDLQAEVLDLSSANGSPQSGGNGSSEHSSPQTSGYFSERDTASPVIDVCE